MAAPPRIDPETAGLDDRPDALPLDALLEDARQHPHRYILSPSAREWATDTWKYLRKYGCDGPMVDAAVRALRLDEEARHARQ